MLACSLRGQVPESDSESIKEQMRLEAPNNSLPSENNLKQEAIAYLMQEKFNEKNDYLNYLIKMFYNQKRRAKFTRYFHKYAI